MAGANLVDRRSEGRRRTDPSLDAIVTTVWNNAGLRTENELETMYTATLGHTEAIVLGPHAPVAKDGTKRTC